MRHTRLTLSFVLLAAGCTADDESAELLEPAIPEIPQGPEELVDDRDPTAEGGGYGILLFDTTSSMTTTRSSTGNTRCQDAKVMAQGIIKDFFDPTLIDGDGIAIWGFTNVTQTDDDVQPTITGYYTDEATAIAAVQGLSCSGSTPLADALCKGIYGDGETFIIDPMVDRLFILTDGFEDNSDGPCSGPSGSVDTPGTWQSNVILEMAATGMKVDTRYWVDPTLLMSEASIDSLADEPFDPSAQELQIVADAEGLPQATVDRLASEGGTASAAMPVPGEVAKECDTTCYELAFFKELAAMSNGSWGVVADDDIDYPVENTTDPDTGPKQPQTTDPTEEPVAQADVAPT